MKPTLTICLQCGMTTRDESGLKLPNPAANTLAAHTMALLNDTPVNVVTTRCLSMCEKPIAWSLAAPGAFTYAFAPATSAEDLAATARAYLATPAGEKLAKKDMPENVRPTLVSRVPPPTT